MNYKLIFSNLGFTVHGDNMLSRGKKAVMHTLHVSVHSKNDQKPVSARKYFKKRRCGALTKSFDQKT